MQPECPLNISLRGQLHWEALKQLNFFCKSYLLEFWVCPAADPLVDVVDVGAGGAGEAEAVGALLDLKDVGARGAEHQHDACRDMWLLPSFDVFSCALAEFRWIIFVDQY